MYYNSALRPTLMATDPLHTLRSAIASHAPITYVSSTDATVSSLHDAVGIRLTPTLVLPKTTPTRFRKPAATGADPSDFVNLEALLVAWLARDASVADYMRQVREAGIAAFVSITERKGVVEWLEGKVADHERIAPLPREYIRLHLCVNSLGTASS